MTQALMDLGPRVDTTPAGGRSESRGSADSGAAFAQAVDQAVGESNGRPDAVGRRESHGRDRSAAPSRQDGPDADDQKDGRDDPGDAVDAAATWALAPHHLHSTLASHSSAGDGRVRSGAPAAALGNGTPTDTPAAAPGLTVQNASGKPATAAPQAESSTADGGTQGAALRPNTAAKNAVPAPITHALGSIRAATAATGESPTSTTPASSKGQRAAADAVAAAAVSPVADAERQADSADRAEAKQALLGRDSEPQGRALGPTTLGRIAGPAEEASDRAHARAATVGEAAQPGAAGGISSHSATQATTHAAAQALPPVHTPAPTPAASTLNSTPVATPTPTPFTQAQPDVANILAQLRGRADGTYQLRAQVHPAELGAVAITATVHHGTLSVSLSPDQTAQQAISQSLPQLRQHLADQGFTGVNVGLGSPNQSGHHGQGGERDNHAQGSDHSTLHGPESATRTVDADHVSTRRSADTVSALDLML